jgi:hypothetical protein
LLQFPETVDMMCMELNWTTELGQAFVADQQGVLDAVQRLRKQAMDVGNLQNSEQMKVSTEMQDGKEVVLVSPPSPEVVYVPQYDPVAVYAPAPAAAPTAAPAAATTGHSTGTLVMTGLLAFGAGMLVADAFNDDDDYYHNNGYYYPNYGHGGMPYYPPYPYRPSYGNGYYPSSGYTRPPNYQHGFNNNNVVVVNNGGGGNNSWNDRSNRNSGYQKAGAYQTKSPITQAKPNRPELQQLNQRQPRPMPADMKRPTGSAARPTAGTAASSKGSRDLPKVQGSYAGATPDRVKAPQSASRPATRDVQQQAGQRPATSGGDRGYDKPAARPQPANRPSPAAKPQPMNKPSPAADRGGKGGGTATSGANRGSADRAASQRGKQSMPQGAKSKGGGGDKSSGGNKGSGGKNKQGR